MQVDRLITQRVLNAVGTKEWLILHCHSFLFVKIYKIRVLLLKKYKTKNGGNMNKNIVIIYGGESTEHDVSVITALQIFKRYKTNKYNINLLYLSRDGKMLIGAPLCDFKTYKNKNFKKCKEVVLLAGRKTLYSLSKRGKLKALFDIDFVLDCCHGGSGENGGLTALFKMAKIPISTGDVAGMAISMDKHLTKCFLTALKIPCVEHFAISYEEWVLSRDKFLSAAEKLTFPVVVKPSKQGSSVGVAFADDEKGFIKSVELGFKYDTEVIVEKAICNKREFNCCLVRTKSGVTASKIEEPKANKVIIDFRDKYLSGNASKKGGVKQPSTNLSGMDASEREFPAKISKQLEDKIVNYSKRFYEGANLNGVVRIDFIYDEDTKKLYLSEANTIPGSLGYYFFDAESYLENIVSGSEKYWREIFDKLSETPDAKIF